MTKINHVSVSFHPATLLFVLCTFRPEQLAASRRKISILCIFIHCSLHLLFEQGCIAGVWTPVEPIFQDGYELPVGGHLLILTDDLP